MSTGMNNKLTNQNTVFLRFWFSLQPYCIRSKDGFPRLRRPFLLPFPLVPCCTFITQNSRRTICFPSKDPPTGWLTSFEFAYSQIPSWRCSSVGFDKCLELCIHPHRITEKFRSPKNSLVRPF